MPRPGTTKRARSSYLEGDLTRLEDADGRVPVPPATGARRERAVQVRDRGGAMVALLDWNAPAGD